MLDYRMDTFLAVCKTMNYTKAAELLHISQPAVSQHIHWLEEAYGVPLLSFEGRKLRLTDAGNRLFLAANNMQNDAEALREALRTGERERFVFGATQTIGNFVLPERIADYLIRHSEADIRMLVDNTESLLYSLDEGALDFAVIEGYFRKNQYAYAHYSDERFICVAGAGYNFLSEPRVLSDLFSERLILRESGSGTREILERALTERNCSVEDFERRLEISSICAIKKLVAANLGVTFLYAAAVREELNVGTLREIPLGDLEIEHPFTIVWRKNSIFDGDVRRRFTALLHPQEEPAPESAATRSPESTPKRRSK